LEQRAKRIEAEPRLRNRDGLSRLHKRDGRKFKNGNVEADNKIRMQEAIAAYSGS
jgi:hypothetical protein